MSTRLYLPSTGTPDISPAPDGFWQHTANMTRRPLALTPGTAFGTQQTAGNAAPQETACRQYVYGPLAAQTISGTVKGQIRAQSSGTGVNNDHRLIIRVVAPDGTVRGTLKGSGFGAGVSTTMLNRPDPASVALTSVASQDGDYLVVEYGFHNSAAASSGAFVTYDFGGNAGTDLPEDNGVTATQLNPWLEFSADIAPADAVDQADPPPPTGVTVTGSNQALTVSWTAPADNRYIITGYQVRIDGGTPQAATSPVTVTGLTNGQTYTVEVRSVTAAGQGAWTSPVSGTPVLSDFLLADTFTRPDSTTAIGGPETGPAPQVLLGTWGISGGKAYPVTTTESQIVYDLAAPNIDLSVDVSGVSASGSTGLIFRVVDSNNFYLFLYESGAPRISIYKRVAGTYTVFNSKALAAAPAGTITLRVRTQGNDIFCYLNGAQVFTAPDHIFATATKHGLRNLTTATARFDNLTAKAYTDLPTVAGATRQDQAATNIIQPAMHVYKGRSRAALDTGSVS